MDLDAAGDTGASDTDDVTNDATPAFSGSAEAGSEVKLYDGDDLLDTATAEGGEWLYEVLEETTFGDGEYEITATATDAAGNTTSADPRTVRVDNTAPDTIVDSSPNDPTNAASISFGFSSGETGATFECSLDGAEFEACESPRDYPDALSDGEHLFKVRAVDEAGNRDDTPAQRRFALDTLAPTVNIDSGPSGTVKDAAARFDFSSENGAAFECRLDGGEFGRCGSPRRVHRPRPLRTIHVGLPRLRAPYLRVHGSPGATTSSLR